MFRNHILKFSHLIFVLMIGSQSCNEENELEIEVPIDDVEVEIQVGTKTFVTEKRTNDGTLVVPMWHDQMPTTDLRSGAGFPILNNAEHAVVWIPQTSEEGAYNHYACLAYHKGKFYAMWGNHPLGEDAPGQRVLFATSETWGEWSSASELFPSPGPVRPRTESGIHLKPDRWAIVDDELFAITYVHGAGRYPIARKVDEDGQFDNAILLSTLNSGHQLPNFMQSLSEDELLTEKSIQLTDWYKENDQISWWAWGDEKWGVQRTAVDGDDLIESFIYRTKDDKLALMLRNWGTPSNPVHNNRMYVSFNDGEGGWGRLHPTDIPDSPSRAQALSLEDGTVLLIGNQNVSEFDKAQYLDRDPMTISVSSDGYKFDRTFSYRTNSPSTYRFPGVGGRNYGFAYSSSLVHDDWLYTLYSIGKEEMGISRVKLSDILDQ